MSAQMQIDKSNIMHSLAENFEPVKDVIASAMRHTCITSIPEQVLMMNQMNLRTAMRPSMGHPTHFSTENNFKISL